MQKFYTFYKDIGHCEQSEAISRQIGDCFVAEFILSPSKGSSQ